VIDISWRSTHDRHDDRSEVRVAHRYAYLDAPLPIPFAHRGGAAEGDENSMAAFARAVAAGYHYLETDVHSTSDDVAVVFHDDTLDRMLGRSGRIEDLSWADVTSLRDGGEPVVPRLADLLDAWPECRLNIDMKADSAVDPTIEAIWKANARDRVLLASFSDRRIRWARRICGPRQATSMGRREVAALRLASLHGRGLRGFVPGVAAVQVPVRYRGIRVVNARFIGYAHRLGMQVHVWTIDDPAEMHELLDLGVDGIMTDRIEVLRDVLIARGRWPSGG
jgi:glycerophosphoryl diester phosphodiesterase